MAIEGTKKTFEITPQTRTRVIVIEIPYGEAPKLTAHREIVNRDNDGKVVGKENALEVTRAYLDVAGESFTCSDGTAISVPHISEALAGLIDKWSVEDAATKSK